MAITVLQSPAAVGFAKNELLYELRTNNILQTGGLEASHNLEMTGFPAQGDTFQLAWNNGLINLEFEFDGTPDDSGLQLPTGSGVLNDYLDDELIPALRSNYLLNRDYSIYRSGSRIYFAARLTGPEYDLNFIADNYAWNNGFTQSFSGISSVERPNFRFLMQLFFRWVGDADWNTLEWERIPIDRISFFDVSRVIGTLEKLLLPAPDRNTIMNINAQVIEYYVAVAEKFGDDSVVQKLTTLDTLRALPGGWNDRDFKAFGPGPDLDKFLTHRRNVRIRPGQPLFLSWYNNHANTDWYFEVDYLSYGQSVHSDVLYDFSCNQGECRLFPCSYELAMDGQALAEEITGLRFWIRDQALQDPTTEAISFTIDHGQAMDEIVLAYKNGMGFFETVAFTGTIQQLTEVTHAEAEVEPEYQASYENMRNPVINKKRIQSLVLHTGYLGTSEAEVFVDLLMSNMVWLIVNNSYWPCNIAAGKHGVRETDSGARNSYAVEVTLIQDKNYSDVGDRI